VVWNLSLNDNNLEVERVQHWNTVTIPIQHTRVTLHCHEIY
jgi:hypothetical protein